MFYDGVWVSHLTFPFPCYRSTATFKGAEHIFYLWGSKKQIFENSETLGGKNVYANRADLNTNAFGLDKLPDTEEHLRKMASQCVSWTTAMMLCLAYFACV